MPDTAPSAAAPLIVIDLQTGMFDGRFDPPIHDADVIAERARALIGWARKAGRKVAFIRHDGPAGCNPRCIDKRLGNGTISS